MRKLSTVFLLILSFTFCYAQGYKNPIIPGFYPDPSVCRVGDDYYLVNSTFEYFPGIPIWHSKDLINWKQIGNVLDRAEQLPLNNCKPSDGIYAPTIRYHDGLFYTIVTLVNKGLFDNFYVTSKNPAGPWSNPIYVNQSGIDPSLFWDGDGRMYFLSNRGYKFSDARAIYQSELDPLTGKRISEPKIIWYGSGGSYVEGPHMYKKDGYYYLLTAEGGTAYGHTVAISRSKNIWGPFESCPRNPILTNRMSYSNLQGTGHADLVEAQDGSWWMVHLAFRPAVDGVHFIGRETCLEPVVWDAEGWPVVNSNGTAQENNSVNTLIQVPISQSAAKEDFTDLKLSFNWIYLRNPDSSNYSLTEKKGFLRLIGSPFTLNDLESPTFVGRRQQHFEFDAITSLEFSPLNVNEEAGITLQMTNQHHYDFFIRKEGGKRVLTVKYKLELLEKEVAKVVLENGPIRLKIAGDKKLYYFSYAQNGKEFKELAKLNTKFLATEVTGGYNGVIIGLYATGNKKKSVSNADFDWFVYHHK